MKEYQWNNKINICANIVKKVYSNNIEILNTSQKYHLESYYFVTVKFFCIFSEDLNQLWVYLLYYHLRKLKTKQKELWHFRQAIRHPK